MLNGDYSFYYASFDSMPKFYLKDFEEIGWEMIDVPSMWQYRGYGKPAYPNVLYDIPFNPPYVSCENPVGYYRRHFSFSPLNSGSRVILHFDGVDNAFYVYLNVKEVGMSKGSRMPAGFDVTDKIKDGDNLLAVKVFTHSDATYLEKQDMLLANRIFICLYLPPVQLFELTRRHINMLFKYRIEKFNIDISHRLSNIGVFFIRVGKKPQAFLNRKRQT